jgi:WD40 repeat protein
MIAAAVAGGGGGGGRRGSNARCLPATGVRLFQATSNSSSLSAAGSLATSAVVPALTFIPGAPHLLATCAHDGTVCVWDLRQPLLSAAAAAPLLAGGAGGGVAGSNHHPRPAEAYAAPQRGTELHCLAVFAAGGFAPGGGGATIAAGASGGDVHFWDRRGGRGGGGEGGGGNGSGGSGGGGGGPASSASFSRPFVTFDDLHMDDVTALVAHEPSGCMLSASQDGLVAVVDVRGKQQHQSGGASASASAPPHFSDAVSPFDADDGFAAALNASTSVEDIGLYGPDLESAWVRTGTETVQLWDWREALRVQAGGGGGGGGGEGAGGAADAADALGGASAAAEVSRPILAAAASARFPSLLPPVAPEDAECGACGVDYLIGCQYDAVGGQLLLAAGCNDGTAALWPLHRRRRQQQGGGGGGAGSSGGVEVGAPVLALRGGHPNAVVRAMQVVLPGARGAPVIVTGGEDAGVCLWGTGGGDGGGGGEGGGGGGGGSGGGVARRERGGSAGPAGGSVGGGQQHHHGRRVGGGGGGGGGGGSGSGLAEGRGGRRTPY